MEQINIGLIGLGNVGSELYKMLQKESERFRVLKIAVKDKNKKRKVEVDKNLLTENVSEIIYHPNISVIADVSNDTPENILERITHKKEWVPKAVLKPYILASKKTMAFYGEEILRFSQENRIEIGFEATVCAGIPIVRLLREGHIPEKIIEVGGILNGTTNYILTKMHEGKSCEDALCEAQKLGFAEADPAEDVSGLDAACKLIILNGLCFDKWPALNGVHIRGIEKILQKDVLRAQKQGAEIKLVAKANANELKVVPCFCGRNSELARKLTATQGVENVVYVKTATRLLYFSGPGAGGAVTAAAMLSDFNRIADKRGNNPEPRGVRGYYHAP